MVKILVGKVYAQLLKAVLGEVLKAEEVEDADDVAIILLGRVTTTRFPAADLVQPRIGIMFFRSFQNYIEMQ